MVIRKKVRKIYIVNKIEDSKFVVPLLSARKIAEINTCDYADERFEQVLSRYYRELREIGLTEVKLAELTGLTSSTISFYLTGKRKPTLYSLTAVCIAMRLYYPRSLLLMKKANVSLDENSLKDRICTKYLIGCGFDQSYNVDTCNLELRKNFLSCLTPSALSRNDWC